MRSIRLRPCEDYDAAFIQAALATDEAVCLPKFPPVSPSRGWVLDEYCRPSADQQVIIADWAGRPAVAFIVHSVDWRNQELAAVALLANRSETIARAAARAFADHVFTHLQVRSIRCQCLQTTPQNAVLLDVGFQPRVRLRQHTFVHGQFNDVLLMILTREDWQPGLK